MHARAKHSEQVGRDSWPPNEAGAEYVLSLIGTYLLLFFMAIEVVFQPTKIHRGQLKTWLQAEDEANGDGFYCNWRIIENSFERSELFCVLADDKAVGFLAWSMWNKYVELAIAEIHPAMRGAGLGRRLMGTSFAELANRGALVADLTCLPPTSEVIWRRMGFQDIPGPLQDADSGVELYRTLTTAAAANVKLRTDEILELWDCEPWEAKDKPPAWTWELIRKAGSTQLVHPIIFPCSPDWQLRWMKGDIVLDEKKVKHFMPRSLGSRYLIYTHFDEVG